MQYIDSLTQRFKMPRIDTLTTIILSCIVMLSISIPSTALVMVKDTQHRNTEKLYASIVENSAPLGGLLKSSIDASFEAVKVKKAPTVTGMKEDLAVKKIAEKANIKKEKIEVIHETLTYTALVEKSDSVFFGEVREQKASRTALELIVPEADKTDEFTVSMLAMGSRLAWPVPGHESLSSHFGHRSSPGGIGSTNHQGIDIPAPTGTPIIAVKEGKVESAGRMGGYGNCVIIDHQNGYKSLYGHMTQITCNAGDEAKPGDVIGKVGSTGNSTGPHLHFSLLKDGNYIDPEPFFTGKERIKAGEEVSVNEAPSQTETKENPGNDPEKETTEKKNVESKEKKETKETKKTTKPETKESTQKAPAKEETKHTEPQKPIETKPEPETQPTQPEKQEPEQTPTQEENHS